VAIVSLLTLACDSPARPDGAGLSVVIPSTIQGRLVSCPTCDGGTLSVAAEFPVTVGDPDGSGGVVEQVRTTVVNRSRGISLGANVRPNPQFSYPTTSVPARASLELSAGLVITPPPPPRDEVSVTVFVQLTDGRTATASAPLVVTAE
jgi:hypothetical protein